MSEQRALEPIEKTVRVGCRPADAFRLFTAEIDRWWPLALHSVAVDRKEPAPQFCGIEPCVGGRLYERTRSGQEYLWGHVLIWEPPQRLRFDWHPGRERNTAQVVEVDFIAKGGETEVKLVHAGWEMYGAGAAEAHRQYTSGWDAGFVEPFPRFVRNYIASERTI